MLQSSQRAVSRGFSLIEVVLAIGIVAFAVVAILGLLAVGSDQFRVALDNTVCSQIAQRVINDALQADFKTLADAKNGGMDSKDPGFSFRAPTVLEGVVRYFDEQGNEVVPKVEGTLSAEERFRILYHVNVRVRPRAEIPRKTHGAEAELAQVTVEVARQGGNSNLLFQLTGATENLFKPPAGVPVYTYSALVGRNE
ncbi:MAG: hypothetical protein QOE70_5533 [Chthoniobacter sp.]|jgi:uncharacterized protein (TIGR02598 family)|nr:hypothetical protein [Chthoniobacter sp.]